VSEQVILHNPPHEKPVLAGIFVGRDRRQLIQISPPAFAADAKLYRSPDGLPAIPKNPGDFTASQRFLDSANPTGEWGKQRKIRESRQRLVFFGHRLFPPFFKKLQSSLRIHKKYPFLKDMSSAGNILEENLK
jgi:hypothetical protein